MMLPYKCMSYEPAPVFLQPGGHLLKRGARLLDLALLFALLLTPRAGSTRRLQIAQHRENVGSQQLQNMYACFVGTYVRTYVIMYAYKHTMHTCRYEQDVTIRTCVHRQDGDLYTVPSVGN